MSSAGKLLFLIGLGVSYRIRLIGVIGVSEILVFLWAPFIVAEEFPLLRRNGFGTFFLLLFLTFIGCIVSSAVNHTHFALFLRGFAQIYSLFSGVVVFHSLLRKDPSAIRWLALGLGISGMLSFMLHGGNLNFDFDLAEGGMDAFSRLSIFSKLVSIPVAGWYFNVPLWFSAFTPFAFGVVCLSSSASGRSLALTLMATGLLAFIGKKSRKGIASISRHFVRFTFLMMVFLLLFKTVYSYSATHGYLGEAVRVKYEMQTRGKNSTFAILMGGRTQFFAGIYVVLKKPFLGYGPWAADTGSAEEGFYQKYALQEVYDGYLYAQQKRLEEGHLGILGGHSHMIAFWTWYGIFGLFLWIYVLAQTYKLFKDNIDAMPVFFGFICAFAPMEVWNIFFSPFGARMQAAAFITVVILMNNNGRRRGVTK